MNDPPFDPDSPAVRGLVRGYLRELDTVAVRVLPGHTFAEYEHPPSGASLPGPTTYEPGDVFSVPRSRVDQLLQRGIVELV